jgi:hypothetical protein
MANGPPFYRLKMSKGTGQGLRAGTVTPIDFINQGADENSGPVAGGAGSIVPPDATEDWGTQLGNETRVVLFQGADAGATFVPVRLVFVNPAGTGGPANWEITEACGEPLDTPFSCNSGDYAFAFLQGVSCQIKLRTVYTGVSANPAEMHIEVYDIFNALIQTIVCTVEWSDASVALATTHPSLLAVYDATTLAPGMLTPGALQRSLVDVSGEGAPDMLYRQSVGADPLEILAEVPTPGIGQVVKFKPNFGNVNRSSYSNTLLPAPIRTAILLMRADAAQVEFTTLGLIHGPSATDGFNPDAKGNYHVGSGGDIQNYNFFTAGNGALRRLEGHVAPIKLWHIVSWRMSDVGTSVAGKWEWTSQDGTLGDVDSNGGSGFNYLGAGRQPHIGLGDAATNRNDNAGGLPFYFGRIFYFADELTDGDIQAIIDAMPAP